MVLEKVKPFNNDEETLAEGQEIYDEAERLYLETEVRCQANFVHFGL